MITKEQIAERNRNIYDTYVSNFNIVEPYIDFYLLINNSASIKIELSEILNCFKETFSEKFPNSKELLCYIENSNNLNKIFISLLQYVIKKYKKGGWEVLISDEIEDFSSYDGQSFLIFK